MALTVQQSFPYHKLSNILQSLELIHNKRNNVRFYVTLRRSRNHCCRGKAISIIYFCTWIRVRACVLVRTLVQPYLPSTQSACLVLYFYLWPLWLHHIFRHYFINSTNFGEKIYWILNVFWFSIQLLFETFLILKRIQRDTVINVKTFLY
jgi:hypothetical protein